ncbi:glutathione synthase [Mucilaginibacter agri]|uniref:Glutathione synthetase n=1 Tax=Mucilaginibacter agri TaxID=2695265 RepID=A0A966DUK7_9SPHI|nr:glutathione synthase [Mucilaginibacter agri]NCD72473.1 glutathione synthase [Mucilaginibacter agri]
MKQVRIGIVMDPISSINFQKDTTLVFMLEAQSRGWQIEYMELADLCLHNGRAEARMRKLKVFEDPNNWFEFVGESSGALGDLDLILMRKDPPFDIEYIMATYILEKAEIEGALVFNKPQALRDVNEKVFTSWFPQCCPPSILTRSKNAIKKFLDAHGKIVIKPTNKMGGQSIFVITKGDPNTNVIIEEMTQSETRFIQAQAYIPEIETVGDKRILLINGIPIDHGIARIPNSDDHRGNLAAGARARGFSLTDRDLWICSQIGPTLRERGLLFVGIDVIGDYLTEINVTSPTCVREIDKFFDTNISSLLFDKLSDLVEERSMTKVKIG